MKSEIKRAWQESVPLTAVAVLMLGALVASGVGLLADHRLIGGMPAWLKPAKFAISTAIYAGTLAWLFRYIEVHKRFVRAMGWVTAIVLVLEVAIIDLQAFRGTTSHFNASTTLDIALFAIMGGAIAVLWLASVGILVVLFRQKFQDRGWGWALRLGMLITVLGSATGGLMVTPTSAQLEVARAQGVMPVAGAHTVGGPDGGPGLPGVGWSTEHGDLRVPHFFGLHAVQVIPFLAWVAIRGGRRTRATFTIAGSYLAFVAILTWQALRGQSIVAPDSATVAAFAVWIAGTAAGILGFTRETASRVSALAVGR